MGEADRHSVWLQAKGLEPKLSPFDPLAMLDEMQRLVPGYSPEHGTDRMNLLSGNDVRTEMGATPGFVPVAALTRPELIVPAHDNLFTSATLGRYSQGLKDINQHQSAETAVTAGD